MKIYAKSFHKILITLIIICVNLLENINNWKNNCAHLFYKILIKI